MCVRGVHFTSASTILRLDIGTVSTVCYYLFLFYYKESNSIDDTNTVNTLDVDSVLALLLTYQMKHVSIIISFISSYCTMTHLIIE